jgi:hypothetical protein
MQKNTKLRRPLVKPAMNGYAKLALIVIGILIATAVNWLPGSIGLIAAFALAGGGWIHHVLTCHKRPARGQYDATSVTGAVTTHLF